MSNLTEVGGDFVVGDDFNLVRDKRGLWTGSQVYYIRKSRLLSLMPKIGSEHPSFSWVRLEDVTCNGEEAGWVKVDAKYNGVQDLGLDDAEAEVENPPEYTLTTSLAEEPLETHPKYVEALSVADIQEASRLAKDPPVDEDKKPVEVDVSEWDELKVELYDFLRRGVESFRDPKVTWTKRWVSTERPGDLNDVGKIDEPEGSPPSAAEGRNWMNMGLNSTERSAVFENEVTWEMSGRGGYLAKLYS